MILRNGIQDLPQGTDVAEKDVFYQDSVFLLREIYIRKKGKGNALNEGIRHARNDLICVLDADCVLQEDALSEAVSISVMMKWLLSVDAYSSKEKILLS